MVSYGIAASELEGSYCGFVSLLAYYVYDIRSQEATSMYYFLAETLLGGGRNEFGWSTSAAI